MLKIQPIDRPFFGVLCLLVIGLFALVFVTLQNPSPSRGEPVQQEQSHAAAADGQSNDNPRGTDQSPFVVKTIPGAPTGVARAGYERDRLDKATNERWLTIWTGIIAIFTIVLAIITGIQARFFFYQLRIMRDGLKDSVRSAKAAAVAAIASSRSARAAVKQAKIAEESLAKLERPYIFIYGVNEFLYDMETSEFYLMYTVANFGRIPAIIDGAWIGFEFSDSGAPVTPTLLNEDHSLLAFPVLAAGEKREEREYLPRGTTTSDGGVIVGLRENSIVRKVPNIIAPIGNQFFFVAKIAYHGPFTKGHRTGALWLNHLAGQFVKRGDAHYNYNH